MDFGLFSKIDSLVLVVDIYIYKQKKMTSKEEFRQFSHAMVDYIIDYHENIKDRPVLPTIKPGYLRPLIPEEAPEVFIFI